MYEVDGIKMELTQIEFLQGVFSLIFVIITFILAAKVMYKYFDKRNTEYLYFGLGWIGIANPWIPDAITFIMILLTGAPLNPILYFIIGFAFFPALVLFWLIAFKEVVFANKYKLFIFAYIVLNIIFEIGFFFLLFTDIEQVGVHITPFQVEFGIFMIVYFLIMVVIALITGMIFSIRSWKFDEPIIKLRGKFIFLAYITFCTAVVVDTVLGATDPIWIIFNRILLMISGILFYIGFMLPERIRKIFIK